MFCPTEGAILALGVLNAGCDPRRAIDFHAMAGKVIGKSLLGAAELRKRPTFLIDTSLVSVASSPRKRV